MRLVTVSALLLAAGCSDPLPPKPPPGTLRFSAVSAGGGHSCAVTPESAAYCWGENEWGQLGEGSLHLVGIEER